MDLWNTARFSNAAVFGTRQESALTDEQIQERAPYSQFPHFHSEA
jgi:hypothetical protein